MRSTLLPCPPISLSPLRTLGVAYVHILLSEVEQEQSGNGDREAIVVGAGLCDGEGERAYTVYGDKVCGERLVCVASSGPLLTTNNLPAILSAIFIRSKQE